MWLKGKIDALELNKVFGPFEFMQDRLSFGTIANSSLSCGGAWFSNRNILIRPLTSSSESSFGFSLHNSLQIWCSFCIFPVCLGSSFSVQNKNRGDSKKKGISLYLFFFRILFDKT